MPFGGTETLLGRNHTMKLRQLVTELYGDRAISQVRPEYRFMLDLEHDKVLDNDLMGFAYGLHLHGTTEDILWAWDCHIKNRAAIEEASKDTHGHRGNRWRNV